MKLSDRHFQVRNVYAHHLSVKIKPTRMQSGRGLKTALLQPSRPTMLQSSSTTRKENRWGSCTATSRMGDSNMCPTACPAWRPECLCCSPEEF